MEQSSVNIIENQLREKVYYGVRRKSVLQRVNQHTGQINTGTCQQCDGDHGDSLIKKNQNGKQQNAHGYPEITGENIKVDLCKKDDENAERQDLFFIR